MSVSSPKRSHDEMLDRQVGNLDDVKAAMTTTDEPASHWEELASSLVWGSTDCPLGTAAEMAEAEVDAYLA